MLNVFMVSNEDPKTVLAAKNPAGRTAATPLGACPEPIAIASLDPIVPAKYRTTKAPLDVPSIETDGAS